MTAVVEGRTGRILAWKDGIPLDYAYTAGVAGERFLRGLKDGRLVASKCTRCGDLRLPPRMYCVDCGAPARIDVEVLHFGRLAALSTAHPDSDGGRLPAGSRTMFGYVRFSGVSGGIVHRIVHRIVQTGRIAPKVGDPVAPKFVPIEKRRGSILDLEGFRPAARRTGGND